MRDRQQQTPGADLRRGSTTYDHATGEYVTDHRTAANRPLRPFTLRGAAR